MSMYRQLWLAIVVSTMLALLGSLLAATLSARAYLSEQLTMKNADNASALALSLNQRHADAVELELTVAALFDSGHYELIRITDPFGRALVERLAPAGNYPVPNWFVAMLPIESAPGRAQISDGWKQLGSIELISHSRFAYQALWKSVWQTVTTLLVAGVVGGYLGSLVLRRLRKPLKAVIDQAQAIAERRFVTIPEPSVPELKRLAGAMNATVTRLKSMFDEEAARLEAVRREANCDTLTGLANRNHFLAYFKEELCDENCLGGSLIVIRLAGLAETNRRLGRADTDELLKKLGAVIGLAATSQPDGIAARLNGADFAVLLPGTQHARGNAERLLEQLIEEAAPYVGNEPTAYMGVGHYLCGSSFSTIMSQVDTALASVETQGHNGIAEASLVGDDEAPRSGEDWAQMIRRALDQGWVRLVSFPVINMAGEILHRECPLRLMLDEHGDWLPAGRFLPMAERLRLTSRLDLAAVGLGLKQLADDPQLKGLAINLSASSVADQDFRRQIVSQLRQQPQVAARLWLEIAETGALRQFDAFSQFIGALKVTGCRVGVEHFGRQFSQIGLLHNLGLDYLKIDGTFVRGLDSNLGNQTFLKGLASIAHGIDLIVIAEGVATNAELSALASIGIDGATGPAVNDPA